MRIIRALVVGVFLCIATGRSAAAQADTTATPPDTTNEDIILLKSDRVLRGRIVDSLRPGVLVLRTRDGKDMVVVRDQIDRVVRAMPRAIPAPPPVIYDVAAADPDTTNEDVIYLKGDRVLRGRIVDALRPGVLVLRTRDGKDMVVERQQIVRVVRATRPALPPPPPVTQRVATVDRHGNVIGNTVIVTTPAPRIVRRKEPALAWALSFVIPGVGQYYNGHYEKGIAFMAIQVVTASLYLSERDACQLNGPGCSTKTIAFALGFINWIATQVDAPVSASAINRSNSIALEVGPRSHSLGISVARVSF